MAKALSLVLLLVPLLRTVAVVVVVAWSKWVLGSRCDFALLVQEKVDPWSDDEAAGRSLQFGVSRATLGLTPGPGGGGSDVDVCRWGRHWLAPGVPMLRCSCVFRMYSIKLKRAERGTEPSFASSPLDAVYLTRRSVMCDAYNSRWWVTCEKQGGTEGETSRAPVTLAISWIEGYTSRGMPKESIESVEGVSIPWAPETVSEMRLFFSSVVPDEALLTFCVNGTTVISFTPFDVRKTHKLRSVQTTSRETRQDLSTDCNLPLAALILRRRNGATVFIVELPCEQLYQVDSETGVSKLLSRKCSDLSQVNESMPYVSQHTVFCVESADELSYELWDCNSSTDQPVRSIQTGDCFDQVLAAHGLLFAVNSKNRQIFVTEASSGLPVITFRVSFPSTEAFHIHKSSSFFGF
ncbi:hypothetical protein Pelo_18175 [Pelomyxa schiedti]|nr:hypothetical protein Pelo_18175 [Pelomyxa schiedti]